MVSFAPFFELGREEGRACPRFWLIDWSMWIQADVLQRRVDITGTCLAALIATTVLRASAGPSNR